jgi:hypothetical protein
MYEFRSILYMLIIINVSIEKQSKQCNLFKSPKGLVLLLKVQGG